VTMIWTIMTRRNYPAANYCVYCGSTNDLSTEHIVPEGLGGDLEFPLSSCQCCADITKRFEQQFSRGMYWLLRRQLGIKGKKNRRKKLLTEWPVEFWDEASNAVQRSIPINDLPHVWMALKLPLPGIVLGEQPRETNPEMQLTLYMDNEAMLAFAGSFRINKLRTEHLLNWNAICRVLARIAISYAAAEIVSDGIEILPLLKDIVLGRSGAFSYLIGGTDEGSQAPMPPPHIPFPPFNLRPVVRYISGQPYLSVLIDLLHGRLLTYEVVTARIVDLDLIRTRSRSTAIR
jgi:hypothetical protein